MIDLDYISIIVGKRPEQNKIEGEIIYLGNVFLLNLSQALEIKLEKSPWTPSLSTYQGILIKETKNNHQITLTGEYFLKENYKEILNKLLMFLVDNKYQFHFTRIDIAHTLKKNINDILAEIEQFNNLDEMTFKKKGFTTYHSFYNSRFTLVIYNKKEQVLKLKKKNPAYYKDFQKKYYQLNEENISRVEVRLKGKDTLSILQIITNIEDFFQKLIEIYIENIKKRLNNTKILTFLTENPIKL